MKRSPAPRLLLLLLPGLIAASLVRPAAAQQATDPQTLRAEVARCAASADSGLSGLDALESACPGVAAALGRLGLTSAFIDGTGERIDAASLTALLNTTRPAAQAGPDPAQLAAVMQDLRGPPAAKSAWQRFKDWFARTFLSRRDAGSFAWLEQWLERLTPGKLVVELLVWGLLISVVGAAIFVVVRELRASDVRFRNPLRGRSTGKIDRTAPFPPDASEDWRQHPLRQRPAALFRHLAQRLGAAGRLPALESHTHRELRQRARFDASDEREAWQALALAAERQIYASQGVPEDEAGRVVEAAERLWERRT